MQVFFSFLLIVFLFFKSILKILKSFGITLRFSMEEDF